MDSTFYKICLLGAAAIVAIVIWGFN